MVGLGVGLGVGAVVGEGVAPATPGLRKMRHGNGRRALRVSGVVLNPNRHTISFQKLTSDVSIVTTTYFKISVGMNLVLQGADSHNSRGGYTRDSDDK